MIVPVEPVASKVVSMNAGGRSVLYSFVVDWLLE
jgi:hypothetical protein